MSKRKRRVEVVVESLAAGGDGVARGEDGRVTFVPRAAPGDRLLVSLVQERKQFARGKIVQVIEPSDQRVDPPCKLFADGLCGGCQWQHVERSAQLGAKEQIVQQGLRHAIGLGMACEPILDPCPPLQWRRRARFSYWAGGPKVLGFFPLGENKKITDIVECPQLQEGLQNALTEIRTHLLPGLSARGEVSVLLGVGGQCHVSIHGSANRKSVQALAKADCIAGVSHGPRTTGKSVVTLEGDIQCAADSFAQASALGNQALCEAVKSAVGSVDDLRLLELYAGTGNFTRLLQTAGEVVAVESGTVGQNASNVTWQKADAAEYCQALVGKGERFDVVILDPPRSGAREVMSHIAELGPKRIVYVSCDVATLARDIAMLAEHGYAAKSAQPIDLMPQTSQVEVVMLLERI